MILSLKAGGLGLNLTSASNVIHYDLWWNPAVENQASDRAHRFGQKNVVHVIKLIAKNTIEEKIVELQDEKRKLIEKIIDNDIEGSNINSLSEEDIKLCASCIKKSKISSITFIFCLKRGFLMKLLFPKILRFFLLLLV